MFRAPRQVGKAAFPFFDSERDSSLRRSPFLLAGKLVSLLLLGLDVFIIFPPSFWLAESDSAFASSFDGKWEQHALVRERNDLFKTILETSPSSLAAFSHGEAD